MKRTLQSALVSRILVLALMSMFQQPAYAKREAAVSSERVREYSARFFADLHRIFGHFRDADLQHVFDSARPIECTDLVSDTGEWREVAFFNEYRRLGDWYRTSLDELKGDPSVYIFKGSCAGRQSSVQLTTKFPVDKSFSGYQTGKSRFGDIDLIVNPPVTARFDKESLTYTFDLPYLFRVSGRHSIALYALRAPTLADHYDPDVTNRWACKSVAGEGVIYQFLICRTVLIARYRELGSRGRGAFYGTSAFSILSDGKEASSSVKLTLRNGEEQNERSR